MCLSKITRMIIRPVIIMVTEREEASAPLCKYLCATEERRAVLFSKEDRNEKAGENVSDSSPVIFRPYLRFPLQFPSPMTVFAGK